MALFNEIEIKNFLSSRTPIQLDELAKKSHQKAQKTLQFVADMRGDALFEFFNICCKLIWDSDKKEVNSLIRYAMEQALAQEVFDSMLDDIKPTSGDQSK